MAFADMTFELVGELDLPVPFVQTKLKEGLGQIYDDAQQQMWSFQVREADNWLAPGLMFASGWPSRQPHKRPDVFARSRGFIFATPYSNKIRGDEEAAEAWRHHKLNRPFLTELQIRSPFFSLYNIIHFDGDRTLTLDRPWLEPEPGTLGDVFGNWEWDDTWEYHRQPYMMYQAYFPTPVQDFKRFLEIKDVLNAGIIDYWSYSQRDLSVLDPQRVIFDLPAYAVFRGWDERGRGTEFESATLGFPLYELWPHPLMRWSYTFSSLRRGPMLEEPHDTLPAPLTEDMLKSKTRVSLYLFKMSQKGETLQRGSGADWQFLAQAAEAEYKAARDRIGKRDVAIIDLYFERFVRNAVGRNGPFATVLGQLNIGGW